MSTRDIRRDVLLWGAVHHCHRRDGRGVVLEKRGEERARSGVGNGECGGRRVGIIYHLGQSAFVVKVGMYVRYTYHEYCSLSAGFQIGGEFPHFPQLSFPHDPLSVPLAAVQQLSKHSYSATTTRISPAWPTRVSPYSHPSFLIHDADPAACPGDTISLATISGMQHCRHRSWRHASPLFVPSGYLRLTRSKPDFHSQVDQGCVHGPMG